MTHHLLHEEDVPRLTVELGPEKMSEAVQSPSHIQAAEIVGDLVADLLVSLRQPTHLALACKQASGMQSVGDERSLRHLREWHNTLLARLAIDADRLLTQIHIYSP